MKPDYQELKEACRNIPDDLLRAHLERLDENYYSVFSLPQVITHVQGLTDLSAEHPVNVLFEAGEDRRVICTVLACDYPSEFSLITGILAATGFNIVSGNIFTYEPLPDSASFGGCDVRSRRMIIDRFEGIIGSDRTVEEWKRGFEEALRRVFGLLSSGSAEALAAARQSVNEMVAARLAMLRLPAESVLYPVDIEVLDIGKYTRLRVLAQDTPAFLYAFSSALALQNLSIEQVRIGTSAGRVQDEIDVLDMRGGKITRSEDIVRIKVSVLLTKQFTYFLGMASDPYAALCRFENMIGSVLSLPGREELIQLLSTPETLVGLARLLGASDYMWEDFIRLQYETLLPILTPSSPDRRFAAAPDEFSGNLNKRLALARGFEERCAILNECKDRQLFLIDLDQILNQAQRVVPDRDVRAFSASLTLLAESIVREACKIIFDNLRSRHGVPRTVAGLEAQWALFGLGKFGGAALGYASDIELLLVFSDNGRTDGADPIDNSEYFGLAAKMLTEVIKAKREGIFHVDIRLRPYGASGPMACSLESFCHYYGPKGRAHSYERLALVRLRAVAGDLEFCLRIERLRDEFIYGANEIKFGELRELREKQLVDKVFAGKYNAKFSPGALVDLEYDIQLLQVMHGAADKRLQTPRIHEALEALSELGVLSRDEGKKLVTAYYFLRRLINGLRMLRGSARDLFLPPDNSLEFAHLARRMGYQRGGQLEPERQLRVEFETQTAVVRAFVEHHFGRDSLPGKPLGNVADLVLSDSVSRELRGRILSAAGFADPERAYHNLRELGGAADRRDLFAPLAVLVCDTLKDSVDADRALNNWERYVRAVPAPLEHFKVLWTQPKRLDLLLHIFAASQFLADTLIRYPDFFNWVTAPETVNQARSREVISGDLREFTGELAHQDWLAAVRRFRRREMLRIGARDICLRAPIREITGDLSALAEALIREALARYQLEEGVELKENFCIIAFGKLGGRELNYSSDVDLLSIHDVFSGEHSGEIFYRAMRQIAEYLSCHTAEGHAYRVDFRLRPYGRAGQVSYSLPALVDYYRNRAELWEIQALLKARPVAGSERIGAQFLESVRAVMREQRVGREIAGEIGRLRAENIRLQGANGQALRDVKNGAGGIRDIEFLVQGLQLMNVDSLPALFAGNTMEALEFLGENKLLGVEEEKHLAGDYEFLRRVEHCLQIFEDRQVHLLPETKAELTALAKRVLGHSASADDLADELDKRRKRVRKYYDAYLAANRLNAD